MDTSPVFIGSSTRDQSSALNQPVTTTTSPFCLDTFGRVSDRLDPAAHTYVEILSSQELFALICNFVQKCVGAEDCHSFRVVANNAPKGLLAKGTRGKQDEDPPKTALTLGLGLFRFKWQDHQMHVLHQNIGNPVGTNCGAAFLSNLVLFVEGVGKEALLHRFCEQRLAENEVSQENTFKIFRWQMQHQYWRRESQCRARPVSSVILPAATKRKVIEDLEDFLEEDTSNFYLEHGIPYKRSYLFHGVPGGGKTSFIQALAGAYGRNVCFLQPTHPEMTDDSLKAAVQRAPKNAIIVLEDIDALFDKNRTKKHHNTPLTFSGLLNALDGCGHPDGQVFILTTNFKNQLDDALVRCGRVDLHVEFRHMDDEQAEEMFKAFYPDAASAETETASGDTASVAFRVALMKALQQTGIADISTASLQHYFIMQRKATSEEAIANVGAIVEELRRGKMVEQEKDKDSEGKEDGDDDKLCEGMQVESRYKGSMKYYPGKIRAANRDGTYDVAFDDGDRDRMVPQGSIKSVDDRGGTNGGEAKAEAEISDVGNDKKKPEAPLQQSQLTSTCTAVIPPIHVHMHQHSA